LRTEHWLSGRDALLHSRPAGFDSQREQNINRVSRLFYKKCRQGLVLAGLVFLGVVTSAPISPPPVHDYDALLVKELYDLLSSLDAVSASSKRAGN
jgi:hypothetical protein